MVAGKVLAVAVDREGMYVQSFPTFGVERRAAPVMTFVRIDDKPIRIRNEIYTPDHVVILDPSLIRFFPVTEGLKDGGGVLINTDKKAEEFDFSTHFRVVTVDAASIALKHGLGSRTQPIVNTSILGAFSRITGIVKLESIVEAIHETLPFKPDENAAAAKEAWEKVNG